MYKRQHSNSGISTGIGKPCKEKNASKARSRGREAGADACDISPTLSVTKRNTKQVKDIHRHDLSNLARERAERKRSLTNEIYHLVQCGDTDKAEENVVTASWSDRGTFVQGVINLCSMSVQHTVDFEPQRLSSNRQSLQRTWYV